MNIPYNTNADIWTFFVNGKIVRINKDDKRRVDIQDAVMKDDEKRLVEILNKNEDEYLIDKVNEVATSVSFGNLKFETKRTEDGTRVNTVTYKMRELPKVLGDYLVKLYNEGCENFDHYYKFLDNILNNPSDRARNELYAFLASRHLPLTDKGTFLAYKGVREDMYSINGNKKTRVLSGTVDSSGHILNNPGSVITVVTEDVDSNCNNYCSCGLHVGTWEYASNFGNVVVAVEVNPADVVSVPLDCGCEKCRVSSYKVLQVINKQFSTTDVKVTEAEAKETTNTPRVGAGNTAKALIKRHGYGNIKEAIDRNIKNYGGKTTIEQLRGSVGRKFGMTSADVLSVLLHLGYTIADTDKPISKRTVTA